MLNSSAEASTFAVNKLEDFCDGGCFEVAIVLDIVLDLTNIEGAGNDSSHERNLGWCCGEPKKDIRDECLPWLSWEFFDTTTRKGWSYLISKSVGKCVLISAIS
jgi:hypothetical protein